MYTANSALLRSTRGHRQVTHANITELLGAWERVPLPRPWASNAVPAPPRQGRDDTGKYKTTQSARSSLQKEQRRGRWGRGRRLS